MTMKTVLKLGAATAAAAVLLTGCASGPPLVPAGKMSVASKYSVTLDRNWADVSKLFFRRAPKVRILSIDGVLLNRLYVSDGLTFVDPLMVNAMRGDTKNSPAPRGKLNMSLSEQMEFVSSSLATMDYLKVETSNPKPVTISGAKGVRFEFTARTAEGLNLHGLAQAVSDKGLNYYIVYIAPEEHYYAANLKNVVATMDSANLP
ncbi:hypothetical protein [Asticcacaulis sp. 201]|uniref:hypothetical protein n=1 Tax=Asticcacaulis sp. 201 TaxID=3028787 RepID=UPI002916671E|nr:hypothetical protein [Asticcacaulis sp. 201]MDV6329843.1 hypothetical protein [Asticcacaulis sp. 201]